MIEFDQAYSNGRTVCKRGLDATPVVVRKFHIGRKEVMSFTNHEKRNRALTAFHFHPDFPHNQRRAYMEAHRDGCELAEEVEQQRLLELAQSKSKWKSRLDKSGKALGAVVHTLVIFALTRYTNTH